MPMMIGGVHTLSKIPYLAMLSRLFDPTSLRSSEDFLSKFTAHSAFLHQPDRKDKGSLVFAFTVPSHRPSPKRPVFLGAVIGASG